MLDNETGMHSCLEANQVSPVGAGGKRRHPRATRIPASERTSHELDELLTQGVTDGDARTELLKLAARKIVEEAHGYAYGAPGYYYRHHWKHRHEHDAD